MSSPSFSDSSDSINSVKKSLGKDYSSCGDGVGELKNRLLNEDNSSSGSSEYVIKQNDIESGGNSRCSANKNSVVTGGYENSGCVSSSTISIMNKQQHTNNCDSVDCAIVTKEQQDNNLSNTSNFSGGGGLNNPLSSSSSSTVRSVSGGGGGGGGIVSGTSVGSGISSGCSDNISSSPDICFSVPTSPSSLTTPIIEALTTLKKKESATSVPTSPESGAQEIVLRRNQQQNGAVINRRNDAAGFRTSRSEDHLQHTQRDILGAVIPIDLDEDVNSSLNTLLDTRHDSEDSQVCTNAAFILLKRQI